MFNGAHLPRNSDVDQGKEEDKFQESIQLSTTPDPGHRVGK